MRRNVDLPQPDGPISEVTWPAGIISDTRSSTWWSPNHALISRASSPANEQELIDRLSTAHLSIEWMRRYYEDRTVAVELPDPAVAPFPGSGAAWAAAAMNCSRDRMHSMRRL
jgi:hypothetical protein